MNSASGTLTLFNIETVSATGTERRDVSIPLSNIADDHSIDATNLRLYPSIWNAHEHLDFNLFPHLGKPPYANAYDWGNEITDIQREPIIDIVMRIPERVRYFWGALKNILSATPFVLHHGDTPRFLFKLYFPLTVVPEHSSPHSLRFEEKLKQRFRDGKLRTIHAAEGTDREAHGELRQLHELGYLNEQTGVVHGVGLRQSDIMLLKRSGAPFIWCPSSNEFLFSKHAPIGMIERSGIPVMLGSDSTLTGSDGMLSEIRFASSVLHNPQFIFTAATQSLKEWTNSVIPDPPESYFVAIRMSDDPYEDFVQLRRPDIQMLIHGNQLLSIDGRYEDIRPTISTCLLVDDSVKYVAGEWAPYINTIVNALNKSFVPGVAVCPPSA